VSDEPTITDIHRAWTDAMYAEDMREGRADALLELRRVFVARKTWKGPRHRQLREDIARYLNGGDDE
jgi:hypothetical protein